MEYTIKRSKRRTLAIKVCRNGSVEVLAPLRLNLAEIERFLVEKSGWIDTHRQAALQNEELRRLFDLSFGDKVLVCGEEKTLTPGKSTALSGDILSVHEATNDIKAETVKFYREHLRKTVMRFIAVYAPKMNVLPGAVRITGAKGSWGSCSCRQTLSFSWRLCMADLRAIEYVVVHELAHITEHNHQRQFWDIVGLYIDDIGHCKRQLKELQQKLALQNWE